MSERVCIVHIGTHKTGTTSLQVFTQENFEPFHQAGLRIAQTGRIILTSTTGAIGATPGNHELAWDLVGDGRTKWDEFLQELRETPCRSALVSSEDFSLLHARPHVLQMMNEELRAIGYTPKIALYLRPQAAYAESMYSERVKQGHVRPIRAYLDTIVAEGRYLPEGTRQDIAFEYGRIADAFGDAFGRENLAVRVYAPKDTVDIFRDFVTVVGNFDPAIAQTPLKVRVYRPRENESLSFADLLRTLHAELKRGEIADEDVTDFLKTYAPEIEPELASARFALLLREEHLELLERFAADNERIAREYGAAIPFASPADVKPADDPVWERARVERAIFDRALQAWTPAPV